MNFADILDWVDETGGVYRDDDSRSRFARLMEFTRS